ncbi:MAG: YihA family ribosome biogenesis GTP-binding protein [Chlamydiales bacterium]|nr:YihA family ribosome biogenesis GTP-binding protein [Chlamydiia bacterium]MCP5507747.1 YihA family ribosome biogenesis GTP-binding protein [Chlamydiales bacterium]
MTNYRFNNAQFIKTAIKPKDYPNLRDLKGRSMLEVAVAGRSNVGKSTLLNHLFQRKNLVKTSSVPGKTQALNFFTIDDSLAFVDLPGYGYAKVPQKIRSQWGPMVQTYLEEREQLKLLLFLLDIRRIPNDDDLQLLNWALHNGHAMILVLTKVDKVKANERKKNTQKILEAFNLENLHYVHYSAEKNVGRKELIAMINDALRSEG